MLSEHAQKLERLAYEGPLSAWQGFALACAFAVLAFWMLFRVPRDARRKLTPLLWLLRVAAIVVLVWTLVGPVHLTVYRDLIPKSLAIVTDVSRSMSVVDPADSRADARWRCFNSTDRGIELLSTCDRAATAAAMARDDLQWLLLNRNSALRERKVRKLESAAGATQAATAHVQGVCKLLEKEGDASGSGPLSLARSVQTIMNSPEMAQLISLRDRRRLGSEKSDSQWIERLEQCQRQLAEAARALVRLGDRIAERTDAGGTGGAGQAGSVSALARKEKVDRVLKAEEGHWLAGKDPTAEVRKYVFDRETVLVLSAAAATPSKRETRVPTSSPAGAQPKPATKTPPALTNLSSVLERVNQDSAEAGIQAVVLFTDGRHNDPAAADPRAVAGSFNEIPLYIVPVGTSRYPRDLILHHVKSPSAVVVGDRMVVEAILTAYDCNGEHCTVELSEGNSVVDRQQIDIRSAFSDVPLRLAARPKGVGRHEYALKVSPVPGEAVATNNSSAFTVDVIDSTLRILVADHVPRWEFRYLVRLFERDPRIEYNQLLFDHGAAEEKQPAGQPRLPHDVEGWSRYRVAILGDLTPSDLDRTSQQALKEYLVDRGGALIVIAGTEAMPQAFEGMPLAELIPVTAVDFDRSQGYELGLTPEGRSNPALQIADNPEASAQVWPEMSRQLPVYSLSKYCVPKSTARTLIGATASSEPGADKGTKAFLCWQTVGRGRIIYVAAPLVYQLRLKYGDRFHHRFWGQLIRWAIASDLSQGSQTVKLATDRSRVTAGQNVQIIATLSDRGGRPVPNAAVRVQATPQEGVVSLIELAADPKIPGRYIAEYSPTAEGQLTLEATGGDVQQLLKSEGFPKPVTTTVNVEGLLSPEIEDTRTNVPLLNQIARLTGGQIVAPTAVGEVAALTNLDPRVQEETVRRPLWNNWTALLVICGVLAVEWTIRKSTGLP